MTEPRIPSADAIPSLDALGDQLETAAARSIGGAGSPSGRRSAPRPTVWLAVAAAFLAVVVVASVALAVNRSGSSTADAAVVGALQRSSALTSGRFRMSIHLGDAADGTDILADGAYDSAGGRTRATVDVGGGSSVDVVLDHGTIFVSLPDQGWARLAGGGGDVTAEAGGTEPASASSAAPALPSGDPSGLFALGGGVADARDLGRDTIDGVATSHFGGSVDLGAAFAGLSGPDADRLAGSLAFFGQRVPRSGRLPLDVWVDDAGTVRRMDTTVDLGALGLGELGLGSLVASGASTATVSVTFSDLGAPVSIAVPDPATVTDLPVPR